MLVISLAAGLVPFDPKRVVALRRVGDVVFKRPVRIGESVHVEGAIEQLVDLPGDAGLVSLRWAVRNQREQLCCRALVDVLWARGAFDDEPFAPTAANHIVDPVEDELMSPIAGGFVPLPL